MQVLHALEAAAQAPACTVQVEQHGCIGLWLRKPWAEWLTVIAGGSLIPFELYQLLFGHHHRTWAVLGATALNIAIVVYLVYRLRTGRHARQRSA